MPSEQSGKTVKPFDPKRLRVLLHLNLGALAGSLDPEEVEALGGNLLRALDLWRELQPEQALRIYRSRNPDLDPNQARNPDNLSPEQVHELGLGVVRSVQRL